MSAEPSYTSFLVVIDDHTDADALSRRLAARPAHLAEATRRRQANMLVSGGAILDSHESGKMVGSALVVNAKSPDHVLELLKSDPYSRQNAWNLDSVKIYPYREANF
ncbi:hypothetical protein LPJ55_002610 [Coemansia sp. RSA 990]|nr:hypothetical protein BX667DRAFT_501510 [Coemansia mojavensis]KAJ1749207.1 hypothetical protein LPJ79_003918 [Coemansia sp. RSA 1821]KAJ1873048.1 hypothetical protein LPJ55_002610 [Coemansia sp. RSA 990]KAJ2647848.1 hypothetical protein IWW40_004373 [Coemansia sp. RSA 1250]KAJ2673356.1 hypothetical protein IWW42_002366 [Coemansia sp. RSA 1085]